MSSQQVVTAPGAGFFADRRISTKLIAGFAAVCAILAVAVGFTLYVVNSASTTVDLELPKYNLVNLSAGIELARGFSAIVYVNNLTDEKALLSFDRERGGRARLGFATNQPRTIGVTLRKSF